MAYALGQAPIGPFLRYVVLTSCRLFTAGESYATSLNTISMSYSLSYR